MDKDFEMEILDETESVSNDIQLPVNFLAFGEIGNDDVKVYIKQDVYKLLEKLSSSDTTKELGSIILGDYTHELGKTHIVISNYIEAKYTDASASTLTFTHETWDYVHKEHQKRFSDKKIIGWQHTHPNYGIFLSNYDLFIQENFFNMPFQIAYVIDPIQNIRGFFQWKNGKVEKLNGYYIYDDVGKPIKIEQVKQKTRSECKNGDKLMRPLVAVLLISVIILAASIFFLNNEYKIQIDKQNMLINEINQQQNEINEQANSIEALKNQLSDESKVTEGTEVSTVKFKAYTIKNGDTLTKICTEHNIDYESNYKIILSINGIENSNKIYVGQTILLPV